MSMLTPPGMGGKKYRITGDRYPRMRRPSHRRRIVTAAVAVAAVVGLAGWGAAQLFDVFSADAKTTQAAPAKKKCPPDGGRDQASGKGGDQSPPAELPKPGAITVNVLNATPTSGLAKKTADELKKRGFKIGKVGNAPAAYDKKIKGIGLLLGAPAAKDGSFKVLGTQLPGADHKTDGRKGAQTAQVDLLLGDKFKSLTKKQTADAALATLTKPKPKPSAPGC